MKIIVVGDKTSAIEFKLKFKKLIESVNDDKSKVENKNSNKTNAGKFIIEEVLFIHNHETLDEKIFKDKAIVFDFYLDAGIENFEIYKNYGNLIIFGNIPKSSLAEVHYFIGDFRPTLFGFNGMPGMLNRRHLEVTSFSDQHHSILKETCALLDSEYLLVDDRVGMVTPRVVSMIINEAYFTVQEGTATKEDIDIAMKLGTHYPYGPFEWSEKIGLNNVYELLEAIYEDTKDERYKICPLLKKEYMRFSAENNHLR